MVKMKTIILGAMLVLAAHSTKVEADLPPQLSLKLWQGPQSLTNFGRDYSSSVFLRNIQVDNAQVPDGTEIQLWTPSVSVTGVPSAVVGSCQVTGGECVVGIDYPMTGDNMQTGNFGAVFYLPAYKAEMMWGWHWRPCQ